MGFDAGAGGKVSQISLGGRDGVHTVRVVAGSSDAGDGVPPRNGTALCRVEANKKPALLMECGLSVLNYPGSDLLSRKLYRHYHRPCSVSRPCSEWERVGPLRQNYREI